MQRRNFTTVSGHVSSSYAPQLESPVGAISKKSKLLAFSSMLSLLAALLVSINTGGQEFEICGSPSIRAPGAVVLEGRGGGPKPPGNGPGLGKNAGREI